MGWLIGYGVGFVVCFVLTIVYFTKRWRVFQPEDILMAFMAAMIWPLFIWVAIVGIIQET